MKLSDFDSKCGSCKADLDEGGHVPGCGNDSEGYRDDDADFVTSEPNVKGLSARDFYGFDDDFEPDEDDRPFDTREESRGER